MDTITLFVLAPTIADRVALRVSASSTIKRVKQLIQKSNGWPIDDQLLCAEDGYELMAEATIASHKIHLGECPTIWLLRRATPPETSAPESPDYDRRMMMSLQTPPRSTMRREERVDSRSHSKNSPYLSGSNSSGIVFEKLVTSQHVVAARRAARRLQAQARGENFARYADSRQGRALQLRKLCANQELRCARLVQSRWRAYLMRRSHQRDVSARRIQAAFRSARQYVAAVRFIQGAYRRSKRRTHLAAADVADVALQAVEATRADGLDDEGILDDIYELSSPLTPESSPWEAAKASAAKLVRRPIGFVYKEVGGIRTLGRWDIIAWRLRYAYTTKDALCYQRVRTQVGRKRAAVKPLREPMNSQLGPDGARDGAVPTGAPKAIPFDSILRVGVASNDQHVLVLQCIDRDYSFRFPSAPHCEQWAAALCAAAAMATTVRAPDPHEASSLAPRRLRFSDPDDY